MHFGLYARAATPGLNLSVSLGSLGAATFVLGTGWQRFAATATAPAAGGRASLSLALLSPGVAWVDLLNVSTA